ncbi:hypothetical protein [Comamonas aquatica]|uniref:hypothetical protein n=1 Tax=Comamonas aquatica TaxID=225991 RepID=UPI0021B104D4|nr:hypothetical protein [Comamonas aquatica]
MSVVQVGGYGIRPGGAIFDSLCHSLAPSCSHGGVGVQAAVGGLFIAFRILKADGAAHGLSNGLLGVAVHGIVLVAVFFAADVAAVKNVWRAADLRASAVFMLFAAGIAYVNAVGFFLCFGGRHVGAQGLCLDQSGKKIVFLHCAVSGVMRR